MGRPIFPVAVWVGPVDETQVVAVPDFGALAVGRGGYRHDAVIGAFRLLDNAVRDVPARITPFALVPADDREIADPGSVGRLFVELPAARGGQVVKRLLRDVEQVEERLEDALEPADAP